MKIPLILAIFTLSNLVYGICNDSEKIYAQLKAQKAIVDQERTLVDIMKREESPELGQYKSTMLPNYEEDLKTATNRFITIKQQLNNCLQQAGAGAPVGSIPSIPEEHY